VFERMELFQLTRSSHVEAMVRVKYNFKVGFFKKVCSSSILENRGKSTSLAQKRSQQEADQVSFKNTVILTLPRCLKRNEGKKGDKSCVINKNRDVSKSRPPILVFRGIYDAGADTWFCS
jgi:hypothetical protein